jgi:hypothetical protein
LKSQEGFRFAYAHYANARFHGACFVKLDDDIVYCDLDRFGSRLCENYLVCRWSEG